MSGLLLDTHVLLWWLDDDPRLSSAAHRAIVDPGADVFVSAASMWEIAVKASLEKLRVDEGIPALVLDEGFDELAVTFDHAWAARLLPMHHRDPVDRLLISQALADGLRLVSADRRLAAYDGIDPLW